MTCLAKAALAIGLLALAPAQAGAQQWLDLSQHAWSFAAEGGALSMQQMNIHGLNQRSATQGWGATAPTWRLEAWLKREDRLNIGVVFQPLDVFARDTIRAPLDARGRSFQAGETARLRYQFPSLRVTANYDVWSGEATELRLGASLVSRYADLKLDSQRAHLRRTNFIILPTVNIEASTRIAEDWRLVARGDVLPGERGTGFYDIFAGVRYTLAGGRALEVGSRSFFGGYLPDKRSDVDNRVFFQGAVARLLF